MSRIAVSLVLLAASGCLAKGGSAVAPGGAGGAPAPAPSLSETMADAPTHPLGVIAVKPPCNQNGYMKLAVAEGAAFSLEVAAAAGSAMVGVLNADGSAVGDSLEVLAGTPATLSAVGQAGATFVTVSETGACAGIDVTVTAR